MTHSTTSTASPSSPAAAKSSLSCDTALAVWGADTDADCGGCSPCLPLSPPPSPPSTAAAPSTAPDSPSSSLDALANELCSFSKNGPVGPSPSSSSSPDGAPSWSDAARRRERRLRRKTKLLSARETRIGEARSAVYEEKARRRGRALAAAAAAAGWCHCVGPCGGGAGAGAVLRRGVWSGPNSDASARPASAAARPRRRRPWRALCRRGTGSSRRSHHRYPPHRPSPPHCSRGRCGGSGRQRGRGQRGARTGGAAGRRGRRGAAAWRPSHFQLPSAGGAALASGGHRAIDFTVSVQGSSSINDDKLID